MTTEPTPHIDASQLITRIGAGEFSREFLLVVARGLLPIEQSDLVGILTYLSAHSDEEVSAVAREALGEIPLKAVLGWIQGEKATGEQLARLAEANEDPSVVEAILRNRRTEDATIEALARTVEPGLQEIIVINQERLIRAPAILEALLENSALSIDIRRRALEVRHEFFEKERRERPPAPVEEVGEEPEDLSPIADLLKKAAEIPEPAGSTLPEISPSTPEHETVIVKLMKMSVSEKVQRAFRGGKAERSILVRDRNKLVCSAVLRSPRITEQEVEQYAGLRNVEDEVLRVIGMNRGWTAKYAIAMALCRNPKTPLGVVLPLINRLTLRDLKELSRDKNVQEGVRLSAKRLVLQKTEKVNR